MNLGRVDFITNQEYDLFIRPDTANPRARLWFHFTVENTQRDQRVIFNVVNLSKWRTLFADGLTPVVKAWKIFEFPAFFWLFLGTYKEKFSWLKAYRW